MRGMDFRRMLCVKKDNVSNHITDKTLGEYGGLNIRLKNEFNHCPVAPNGKRARCSLHRWANYETQKHVIRCSACSVNLCVKCWKVFHTEKDLNEIFRKIDKL